MALSQEEKAVFVETANVLKGSTRRIFMARVVKMLGPGGQRLAERELGWNRGTIRKGMRELERGKAFPDQFSRRGRKRAEQRLPNLMQDLKEIMNAAKQTDLVYQTTNYYFGITVAQIRECLIKRKGYSEDDLPNDETLRVKLKQLNYHLKPRSGGLVRG